MTMAKLYLVPCSCQCFTCNNKYDFENSLRFFFKNWSGWLIYGEFVILIVVCTKGQMSLSFD